MINNFSFQGKYSIIRTFFTPVQVAGSLQFISLRSQATLSSQSTDYHLNISPVCLFPHHVISVLYISRVSTFH